MPSTGSTFSVNDIPVFGTERNTDFSKTGQARTHEQEIQVPLVPGRNKIQVSVLNQQGTESLRETVYTTSTAPRVPPMCMWWASASVNTKTKPTTCAMRRKTPMIC